MALHLQTYVAGAKSSELEKLVDEAHESVYAALCSLDVLA